MNTSVERNPQAAQMADESMLRTLRFQIEAIWPQESRLFARYALPVDAHILDVGCGTGEATLRLAAMFPGAGLVCGVDVMPELLAVAQHQPPPIAGRMPVFEQGDGYALRFADASFDLVVCRHVTQLLPEPERLLAELRTLEDTDTLFNAPVDLAATICGFDPSAFSGEVEVTGLKVVRKDLMKLRDPVLAADLRDPGTTPPAGDPPRPGFLARLFGRR